MPQTADAILRHLQVLGYQVRVYHRDTTLVDPWGTIRGAEYVEMHATEPVDPAQRHVARVWGAGDDADHHCARRLAESVGLCIDG